MARQSSSGNGGAVVAVVIFVFTTVVFGVTTILFYSQVEEAKADAETAKADLAKFATASEVVEANEIEREGNETVYGKMKKDYAELQTYAVGTNTTESVQKQNNDINAQLQGAGLGSLTTSGGHVPLIKSLIDNYSNITGELDGANAQIADLQTQLTGATERNAELETDISDNATARDDRYDGLKDDIDGHGSRLDELEDEFKDLNEQVRENTGTVLAAQLAEYQELQRDYEDLLKRWQIVFGGPNRSASSPEEWRTPDGKVVGLLQGGEFVTVDLGYDDKVFAGMSFEVFDTETGVVVDEDGALRGHASIILTKVEEDTSVGRIVRLDRNAIIRPQDTIANVVYHPKKVYKFHVFGDFDIKNNGNPTLADRRRIEGMINRFGGKLSDDLGFDVDYLVLGIEPELPAPLDPNEIDPVRIKENQELTDLYNKYQELVGQATALQIPILNQNRFLALVGYHSR